MTLEQGRQQLREEINEHQRRDPMALFQEDRSDL
jgi:hypothetical protein